MSTASLSALTLFTVASLAGSAQVDASMKTPIMVLSLEGVGILRVAPLGDQDANPKSAVRRIEAQLYVESVRLEIR